MDIIERLVSIRSNKFLYPFFNTILLVLQVEIPKSVILGKNIHFQHRAMGLVIHPLTRIGNNVTIYHGVTIGSMHPWSGGLNIEKGFCDEIGNRFCIDIQDDVVLCAGCKILCAEKMIIAKGSIIAANAVLMSSTSANEIWAGIPAKCIGKRKDR